VLGNVDKYGARASASSEVEGFVNDLGDVLRAVDHEIMLGRRAGDAECVGLLEGVAANQISGDLAGEGDDRNRIHHGVDETGHEVRGTGSRSGAADSDLAGGASVALGREGSVLLVAD